MKSKFKFPSIETIRIRLVDLNRSVDAEPDGDDGGCDVRLQVTETGWKIWLGLSDYDTDHRGVWGSSSVPGCDPKTGKPRRFNAEETAKDLIKQAREHAAQCETIDD